MVESQYWLFVGICLVALLLGSAVPFGILLGPMMCGIYLCLLGRARGETIQFETLFKGFDFFLESFIATLFQMIPMVVIILPVYIVFAFLMVAVGASARDSTAPFLLFGVMGVMFVVILVIALLISALFIFAFPLIVDRRLSGVDAVKTSVRAVMGNAGGVAGLMLLQALLGVVGVLFCYVGVFLVLPISFAAVAVAYQNVFPREAERFSPGS